MKIRMLFLLLPLGLCGCQAIGDWFDSVGEHMPVIGERCEHWQCFTSSGQAASDAEKAKERQPSNPPASAVPVDGRLPANTPQSPPMVAPPPPSAPNAGVALPEYENPPSN